MGKVCNRYYKSIKNNDSKKDVFAFLKSSSIGLYIYTYFAIVILRIFPIPENEQPLKLPVIRYYWQYIDQIIEPILWCFTGTFTTYLLNTCTYI